MNNIKIESVTNDEATSSIPYKSKQVTKSLSLWFELKVFFFFSKAPTISFMLILRVAQLYVCDRYRRVECT